MSHTTMQPPFMYEDFQEALDSLTDALTRAPAYALLLGDSGSGKTTLLRTLAAGLDRRRFHILYLCHGQPSPSGLARVLAEALHLPIRRSRAETSRLLVQTLRNLPTRLLFFIDEAQLIRSQTRPDLRIDQAGPRPAPMPRPRTARPSQVNLTLKTAETPCRPLRPIYEKRQSHSK